MGKHGVKQLDLGRVICSECGSAFGRKTWNSTDEEVLFKAFVSSFNALVENKGHFVEKWKTEDGNELNGKNEKKSYNISID